MSSVRRRNSLACIGIPVDLSLRNTVRLGSRRHPPRYYAGPSIRYAAPWCSADGGEFRQGGNRSLRIIHRSRTSFGGCGKDAFGEIPFPETIKVSVGARDYTGCPAINR